MTKARQRQTDLPKHLADAIRDAWPDGVINGSVDWDDAPFWAVYPKLKAALSHIPRSAIFYDEDLIAGGVKEGYRFRAVVGVDYAGEK